MCEAPKFRGCGDLEGGRALGFGLGRSVAVARRCLSYWWSYCDTTFVLLYCLCAYGAFFFSFQRYSMGVSCFVRFISAYLPGVSCPFSIFVGLCLLSERNWLLGLCQVFFLRSCLVVSGFGFWCCFFFLVTRADPCMYEGLGGFVRFLGWI